MCPGVLAQSDKETAALTDNQRRTMPLAELIDSVISQQRSANELQVWFHETLPEFENLGALNWAKLRQGNFIYRRAGLMNKRISSLPKVQTRKPGRWGSGQLTTRISAAVKVGWARRGMSRPRHCPASNNDIFCRFYL